MAHPTIGEIADKLNECKKNVKGDGEQIPIDPHTLVWAEYWLRWAMEKAKSVN